MSKKKKILYSFFVLFLSTTVAVLIGELLVRLIVPQQLIVINDQVWTSDSFLGWKHVSNSDQVVNLGEKKVRFVSDEKGNRINPGLNGNTDCTKSILFLGDSFLEALQVENENTFPELIRQDLEIHPGFSVCVSNTGVGGWSPNQYYLQAKKELLDRKYDLGIVCLYVGNDFLSNFDTLLSPRVPAKRHRFRMPGSFAFSEWKKSVFYPVNDWLETRSHFFILLKNSSKSWLTKAGLTAEYFPPVFEKLQSSSTQWEVTARICAHIKRLFQSYNTPVFFILLPTPYQVHPEIFQDYVQRFKIDESKIDLQQPNDLFSAAMNQEGILLLDPLDFMRLKANEGISQYGKVDSHFNENGHLSIAEYLKPYIFNVLTNSTIK